MERIDIPGGMFVQRIDDADNDLKIVNAARVSMGKRAAKFVLDGTPEHAERKKATGMGADDSLLWYLAKHDHWTPFAHCRVAMTIRARWHQLVGLMAGDHGNGATLLHARIRKDGTDRGMIEFDWVDSVYGYITRADWLRELAAPWLVDDYRHTLAAFGVVPGKPNRAHCYPIPWGNLPMQAPYTVHLKVPIFVARQLMKSNYGIVYNEISRRYVDTPPEFYMPPKWRHRPEGSIKQGSGRATSLELAAFCDAHTQSLLNVSEVAYNTLLANGIAPELARMVLPQNQMVEMWMTASKVRFRQFVKLRTGEHVQHETRLVAKAIREAVGVRDV